MADGSTRFEVDETVNDTSYRPEILLSNKPFWTGDGALETRNMYITILPYNVVNKVF